MKKIRHLKSWSWLLLLLIFPITVFAQDRTVSGKVLDESNLPLPGASVKVKVGTGSASTDVNGAFKIRVPQGGATLVVSFIGYVSKEVAVSASATTVTVTLVPEAKSLSEVVVVGYGTQKRSDVTGSVASVDLQASREVPNTNIAQYLQGSAPGLNVGVATNAGGTPPIQIRGQNTLSGSTSVLIILDGIQYNGSLSSINPDDIASIDVLKDASSTAVYGAQAANGVILITSRKGQANQPPRIAFSSAVTTQSPTTDLRPMNREEYLADIREAYYKEAYLEPDFTRPNPAFNVVDKVDPSNRINPTTLKPNDYDWWEEGTNRGLIVENSLSISGGGDRVNYLLSGSLVNQKGTIVNDHFKRKTLRANLETKALNWWKIGLVSSGSFVNQDGSEPAFGSIIRMSPLLTPYDESGNLIVNPTNTLELNPFTTYYVDDRERNNYYFANIYSDIDFPFLKGLNYRLNFGNNLRNTERAFASLYASNLQGEASRNYETYYDYMFDNILTYSKKIDKHDLAGTLVYGVSERKFSSSQARATGFTRLNLSYNNLSLGTNQFSTSAAYKEALEYQMARLNYKYNNKYLLTATLRRDGFSGFAKNNKYGIFPVVAAGWVMSEENFLKDVPFIDFLKLRIGYGEIGNQAFRYSSLDRVDVKDNNNNPYAYIFGDGGSSAFAQHVATLGNPDLKWERTKGSNFAVDFNLFGSRLNGTLEYYLNNTEDLLFDVLIPTITGFDRIPSNIGQIRNQGFEASITGNIMKKKDFSWTSTLNFATNKNSIIHLTGVDANGDGKEDDIVGSNLFIGKSINVVYHYQTNGIYQLTDTRLPGFPVGSLRVVDQNNSGTITTDDRVFLGKREPAYRISLRNTFGYKGFTLSTFINSVQGGKDGYLGNDNPSYFRDDNSIRANNVAGLDFWSPANPNGTLPRVVDGTRSPFEVEQWRDRSFVRLQDVSLSYNLPGNLIKKIKAQNVSFYVSGKNLVTWTDWKGWDPEPGLINNIPHSTATPNNIYGRSIAGRPVMKAFTLGVNVTY